MNVIGWCSDVSVNDVVRLKSAAADSGDTELLALCRVALGLDLGDMSAAQEVVAEMIRSQRRTRRP